MNNSRRRQLLLSFATAVLALIALAAITARADSVIFDPDGLFNPNGTGSLPAVSITGFDPAVGNALAQGGIQTVGSVFNMYYQGTLQGYSGGTPPPPTGINGNFQITFSLKVTELVTGIVVPAGGGAIATFQVAPVQAADTFFRMYYNGAATTAGTNGNLTGLTFQDGQVILNGIPTLKPGDTGNFQIAGNGPGVPLLDTFDKNGTNNYPGIATVVGNGSAVIDVDVLAVDPTFFVSAPSALQVHLNTSLVLPFDTVDPSHFFRNRDLNPSIGATAPGTLVIPNIGTVNGVNGTDMQFQADANASIVGATTTVPDGADTLLLMTIGVLGLLSYGWANRRRAIS
jgi:hypothetical protein